MVAFNMVHEHGRIRPHHPDFHAVRAPGHPALVMADSGAVLSYGELVAHANQLAHLLVSLGCREDDCVAILMQEIRRAYWNGETRLV